MLKYNQTLKNNCDQLVLFTSESCNLQCSYCDMASHINKELHAPEAKNVKESLINGQYFQTVKTSLERLEINPSQITHLELWGQEPTLTLTEFGIFFPELYQYCNEINSIFFSTNGVGNIDKIINLVNVLNKNLTKFLVLHIQFSYDGKYATKQHRGVNPQIVIDNIIKCINLLNETKFDPYLKIIINFHNVISDEIINYYADEDKQSELLKYLKEFNDLSEYFIELNNNPRVEIRPFSPGIINPYNATVESGKNLYKFYQNCEVVNQSLQWKNNRSLARQLFDKVTSVSYEDCLNILKNINTLEEMDVEILNNISHKTSCGFGSCSLKVRYDGTMIHCQNVLFGLTKNELQNIENNHDLQIQKRRLDKGFYPNIIKDSDEVIDNYLYQCDLQHNLSFPAAFAQASMILMNLLHAGQIDTKYGNKKEFLKCVYYFLFSATCPHNALMQSGTVYGHYSGWGRFLCNGFMDIIQQEHIKYLQEKNENERK